MRTMPIDHFSLEDVDELDSIVLEQGKDVRGFRDHDQVGLDSGSPVTDRMAQQVLLMTRASAAAIDDEALTRLDEGRLAILLVLAEKSGYRNIERSCKGLQRCQRWRCLAILDLGQHPRRQIRLARQIGNGRAELRPVHPNLPTDGVFKPMATLRDRTRQILVHHLEGMP